MPDNYYSEVNENGVVTPFRDLAAFPRSEQAVLGAKNLLPYPYPNNPSLPSGLFSADGAFIIADGTASGGDKALQLSGRNDDSATIKLQKGNYILSGNPNTDGSTYIQAFTTKNGSFLELALTSSATEIGFSVTDDILVSGKDYAPIGIIIGVRNNKTVDNAIFKPMIRLATDTDSDFAPYAMPNRQLTEMLAVKTGTITDVADVTKYTQWSFIHQIGNLANFQYRFTVGASDINTGDTVIADFGIGALNNDTVFQFVNRSDGTDQKLLAVNVQGKLVLVGGFTLETGKTYVGNGVYVVR